ncbi:MAG: peptidoglycan recognition protein family protein [Kiritimatiellia bacterium]
MALPSGSRREFMRCGALGLCALILTRLRTLAQELQKVPSTALDGWGVSDLEILPRRAWTSFVPRVGRMGTASPFERITFHHRGDLVDYHTDIDEVIHRLDGVLGDHLRRDYGDIGYHFVIDHAGRIWEGRALRFEGAHVAGQNAGNIGVMLLGNFEHQNPSSEQVWAAKALCLRLRKRYRISARNVYGHKGLAQSLCPGRYFYHYVQTMRDEQETGGREENDIHRADQSPS